MALIETNIDWNSLIKFTSSGVVVAEYYEIKSALTKRFKEIYGEDIDLSNISADGIYVENLCLMINNILQSFKQYYSQLDVNTASGIYLDRLCNLTNITRKTATRSTATVYLTLDPTAENSYSTTSLTLADQNGNTWSVLSSEELTFKPGVEQAVVVSATNLGPITAPKNWINQLVNNNVVMTIRQDEPANIGSYEETDSELRSRRNNALSGAGTTVLESLVGALTSISGIEDAKVYNNNTLETLTSKDTTSIEPHCVYVVLRIAKNIEITDATIGTLIYEKMTPGIPTAASSEINGKQHSFIYKQSILGQFIEESFADQEIYWKVAESVNPEIQITITPNSYYASANDTTAKAIAEAVINDMNKKLLSKDVKAIDISRIVEDTDPRFRGNRTYEVKSVFINSEDEYINRDTYYYYYLDNVSIETKEDYVVISIR